LGDDLENAQAARRAKKVVGIPGVIAPIYANPTNMSPKTLHNHFFITSIYIV
jgi:hypothetical protein